MEAEGSVECQQQSVIGFPLEPVEPLLHLDMF
jgi:hypothetical protein